MDRRTVLGLGAAALAGLSTRVFAEEMNAEGVLSSDPTETIALWPGMPPGGPGPKTDVTIAERSTDLAAYHDRAATGIGKPLLTVFRPQKPDGSAVMITPGGGYARVVLDKEGFEGGREFNKYGVTVFVLRYRLPGEGWANRSVVPLQDAQRGLCLIRARAAAYGIDPARVGVLGFSAGGHLAASLATRHAEHVYAPVDVADVQDAKPAFAGLIYGVYNMSPPYAHPVFQEILLGKNATPAAVKAASCDQRVTASTPPAFLCQAADDPTVNPQNMTSMYAALKAAKVPAEMHMFEEGGHGFGIRLAKGKPASAWPELFLHWAYSHGWLRDPSAAPA